MAVIPTNLEPVTPVKLREAVRAFIIQYAAPKFQPDKSGNIFVLCGNNNRMHLPTDNEDYAVFTVLNQKRVGTNLEQTYFTGEGEGYHIAKQVMSDVQIDFYSTKEENALRRAEGVEILTRGEHATNFFEQYGISCAYADDVTNMAIVGSTLQYIHRYSVTIKLVYYAMYDLTLEYATAVDVEIENVDVHHPIKD